MLMPASWLVAFLLAISLEAQEFEVATLRQSPPAAGGTININLGTVRNGKVTFTNASLSDCLKFAWQLVSDEQLSGPEWIRSKDVRFDIVAQAPPDTPREKLNLMVQALLAERLKLAVHLERKPVAHLSLLIGKTPPRLKPADSAGGNKTWGGSIAVSHLSMQTLATLLSRFENQTVVDETGLAGEFAFTLDWTTESASQRGGAGPSIFTALQEQLGLRLESRKTPLDVLVIDRVDRVPAEN